LAGLHGDDAAGDLGVLHHAKLGQHGGHGDARPGRLALFGPAGAAQGATAARFYFQWPGLLSCCRL
jgi:hypothetical protein